MYEGEVTELTPVETENPGGGYGKVRLICSSCCCVRRTMPSVEQPEHCLALLWFFAAVQQLYLAAACLRDTKPRLVPSAAVQILLYCLNARDAASRMASKALQRAATRLTKLALHLVLHFAGGQLRGDWAQAVHQLCAGCLASPPQSAKLLPSFAGCQPRGDWAQDGEGHQAAEAGPHHLRQPAGKSRWRSTLVWKLHIVQSRALSGRVESTHGCAACRQGRAAKQLQNAALHADVTCACALCAVWQLRLGQSTGSHPFLAVAANVLAKTLCRRRRRWRRAT